MTLNDLLKAKNINPQHVVALRHRPWEAALNDVLPWLAAGRPTLYNAFQQHHSQKVEQAVTHAKYVASFIRHEPGQALFVGIYAQNGSQLIDYRQFWQIRANIELRKLGMHGLTKEDPRSKSRWFDLVLTDIYATWKGKLIVKWPPLDRNWFRWAFKPKNEMPVHAILEESALDGPMKEWHEIKLTWDQLAVLPTTLKSKLREWRGIYFIFDTVAKQGYVGSAYGQDNLLGRWENYAATGHGGNRLLRRRDPRNFLFTILDLDAPNRDPKEVLLLEKSWKQRLHTRAPNGLNDN
jgi:hypothetical protein